MTAMINNGILEQAGSYQHLAVNKIAGALGAEIGGIDLSQPLSDAVFKEVQRAFAEHQVIFFRGQQITPEQHKAFSLRFGGLLEVPFVRSLEGHPEILAIMKGAQEITRRNFGGVWHSDMSYAPEPPLGSILCSRVVPPYGGDTLWSNMYLAYERLSEGMQRMLDPMNVVHSAIRSYGAAGVLVNNGDPASKMDVRTDNRAAAEVTHPAVRIHPVTGRKALYVNSAYSIRFEDMTEEESKPLLDFLFAHCSRPEHTCRLRWSPGTIAMWDNRCTQHLAMNDYDGFDRELHRTTIMGDKPIPATPRP